MEIKDRPKRPPSPVDAQQRPCLVDAVLFDFGGVLAEEGFRRGLEVIAIRNGLEPEAFKRRGFDAVHDSGYVTGRAPESAFWSALRNGATLHEDDAALREIILSHFVLRPWMIGIVAGLKERGVRLAILSDQTDWLEELDRRHGFFKTFEKVFNSYRMGKSKRDHSLFDDVLGVLGTAPDRTLFVDDHPDNIERAEARGLRTIHYVDRKGFGFEMARWCPFVGDLIR